MLPERILWFFDPKFAGHTQMEPQPQFAMFPESENHLLSASFGIEKPLPAQSTYQLLRIDTAKDARLPVAQSHFQNLGSLSHLPKTTAVFYFSQLRHLKQFLPS